MHQDLSNRRLIVPTILVLLCGLTVSAAVRTAQQPSPSDPLVIYFSDGPFFATTVTRDDVSYLDLTALVRRMALPYTDATGTATFTVRGPTETLVVTNDDTTIAIGEEQFDLATPPFRDDGRWFVPIELLTDGLARISGVDFRYEPGAPRLFAGIPDPTGLDFNAERNDSGTRLTIRSEVRTNVRVQRIPEESRVILLIDQTPLDPSREALDYRDASIRSVRFDDTDGTSKVIVEISPQVAGVRLTPTEENRTFFVDFVPESVPLSTAAEEPAPNILADQLASRASSGRIRVIVIDPGHGGLDGGTEGSGTLEKALTLTLARRLRARLQNQLDATLILTRDSDLDLNGETRSAIANNNKADLLISLHIGFSTDSSESGASLFVMKDTPSSSRPNGGVSEALADAFFKPWFRAYETRLPASRRLGNILRRRLSSAAPGWGFPVREAPISILASATMPAVVVELGNANNPANLAALTDAGFQGRLIEAIAAAVEEFGNESDALAGGDA